MPSPGMHILLSLKQHIRLYHKPHISGFCTYRFTDNGSRFTFFALSMDDGRSETRGERWTKRSDGRWTVLEPIGSRKTVHGSRLLYGVYVPVDGPSVSVGRNEVMDHGRSMHLSVHGQRFTSFCIYGISLRFCFAFFEFAYNAQRTTYKGFWLH
jgi:hypothetical protein